ncbi:GcrA family cell cycle regulator [Crenalkalicoccus roseus]|uniref:GcrA family cell cycle regulator n=1 Tax=Crenalkalicoccus roseus TaxID=1485588 RepID=UPI001EFF631B|nr:GcrA family cell cycle regulator [Crenalkalicoccus roseus]
MSAPAVWTPAMVDQLRALWAEGHSTAEIGRRMGVSKNAVIAKAHRLDLPARKPRRGRRDVTPPPSTPSATRRPPPAAQAPAARDLPAGRMVAPRAAGAPLSSAPAARPLLPPALRSAIPLPRERGCQWPHGDPRRPGFRFCEAPRRDPACPYCAAHAARAYCHPDRERAA